MLENIPSQSTMIELLGQSLFEVWQALCSAIDEKYDMERLWNTGGKNWTYEYKYRRGGKTLCCLYAKSNCIGFMIIFGKDERAKFEDIRDTLSDVVCRQYDEAKTYQMSLLPRQCLAPPGQRGLWLEPPLPGKISLPLRPLARLRRLCERP